jgi:uncharacterized protein (TIGR00251 family)
MPNKRINRTAGAGNGAETIRIRIRVKPNARKTGFEHDLNHEGIPVVSVKAAPTDGKANLELIAFLAREFKTTRGHVKIVSGVRGRTKTVSIGAARNVPPILAMQRR